MDPPILSTSDIGAGGPTVRLSTFYSLPAPGIRYRIGGPGCLVHKGLYTHFMGAFVNKITKPEVAASCLLPPHEAR
eukprot:scaffold264012_cov32-Tisochrysis_lutea.AAC.2